MRKLLRKLLKGFLRDIFWMVYGRTMINPEITGNPKFLLFVCDGNRCRSPFAHKIAKKIAERYCSNEKKFLSAGLEVIEPHSPKEACAAAKFYGTNLKDHRAVRIEKDMLENFDMVIAMTPKQISTLKKKFPDSRTKFFLLPLFDVSGVSKLKGFSRYNIIDPYGNDMKFYYSCFGRIERCVTALINEIERN